MDTPCLDHGQGGDKHGYGRIRNGGKSIPAHRIAYAEHHNISVDDILGYEIRHLCHNPRCVNPSHLLIGTHADNMRDMAEAGRAPSGVDNVNAKLSKYIVSEIRRRYVPRCRVNGARALAKEFCVAHATICKVASWESYT